VTVALVLAASLPFLFLLLGRPVIRHLALRSMARRPVELFLVVVGSMLATAILTGSLLVGDTVDRSIRSQAYDQLGPIDELIVASGQAEGERLWAALDGFASPEVDGTLPMLTASAAAVGMGEDQLVQPTAQLVEVDFEAAAEFGGDRDATGIEGPTPPAGNTAITSDLAARLRVEPGDPVVVHAYGASQEFQVDRILPRTGIAGFWLGEGQRSYNVFVPPGTIAALAAGAELGDAEPPRAMVAVSNVGDVEGGAGATAEVTAQLEDAVGDVVAGVRPVKETVLDVAETVGSSLGDVYFTVGMFAVAAGILLLVNIFVMLGDERRRELGMMRAIGLRRTPMVGQFAAEGWIYALVASVAGALVGIGLGWAIAWRSAQILSSGREVDSLQIEFAIDWTSVLGGFAIGFLISLVTIILTSVRIARLNVIAAIRDLPDMHRQRPRRRWSAAGAALAVVGVAWTILGLVSPDAYGILIGPVAVALGLTPIAARRWHSGAVATVVSAFVLGWGLVSVPMLGDLGIDVDIPIFLVQGLTVVAAGVALVSVHQASIGRAVARLAPRSLAVRMGLAYPLARRSRTALTLGMVAIVVLTLTYISVISEMVVGQADRMTTDLSGGFDVVLQSNPSNPVLPADLAAVEGVERVAPIGFATVDFVSGADEPVTWPVSGFDETLVEDPPALDEIGDFASDEMAWRAVLADPGLIIVDEFFLVTEAGPPGDTIDVGDTVTMIEPLTGEQRQVRVGALTAADILGNGAFYGRPGLAELVGDRLVDSRSFVAATQPDAVVEQLRTTFVANGVEADTIRERVDTALALENAFFTLMQQFVGAGLVVGMAGIGVIMVRSVRERRREIGVLRSLGCPTPSVARTFVVEASFVTVEAVLIGVLTALAASYGLSTSATSWAEDLEWTVPLADLAIIVGITLTATVLASLWPARSAARTKPAVALRLAD
jgi:putative ABC transport system permease protein